MSQTPGVLILGAGQAGAQTVHSLRAAGYEGAITLTGAEAHAPYQRPPLSKAYLLGQLTADHLELRPADYWAANGVDLRLGAQATAIDRTAKRVAFTDGAHAAYDVLVVATGARARALPIPGADLDGVMTLRGRDDADALGARLKAASRVLIVGGGFIGLEIAAAARAFGREATVLEAAPRLLARTSGGAVSEFYRALHTSHGVDVRLGHPPEAFLGETAVTGVRLVDGTTIEADLVVLGVGAAPNVEIAEAAGLECANGIVTDEQGRTSDPTIYAVGDVAAAWSPIYERRLRLESVQNAIDGAKAAAAAIVGKPAPAPAAPWNWSDQYDVKLQIAGVAVDPDATAPRGDPESAVFAAFYLKDGRIVGCDAVNEPHAFVAARQLIARRTAVDPGALCDTSTPMKSFLG